MHNVRRGALDIWLRMVMRDINRQESNSLEARRNLRFDIANEDFTTGNACSL